MLSRDSQSYIPFNSPYVTGREFAYIEQAIRNLHLSGSGPFTQKCQQFLESELGVSKVLLTTSCTHALEMAALLLDIQPGDEVIVPSFTFVTTVNAFVLRGARPVFVDVHPDTLNMDETKVEALVTNRTKAIVPVHYAGVGCELDTLLDMARHSGLAVVEDNAHGLLGKYKGRNLGTFGDLATLSFHETKNFTCGEGGALLINNPRFNERAEIIREKGTDRSRFFRGMVDKYTWVDVGSSYIPADILAAYLLAQLESAEEIQAKRKRIWDFYYANLCEWAVQQGVQLPTIPPHCEQSYHMFYLLMPSLEDRQALIAHLADCKINSVFHYVPLHLSAMGKQFGGRPGDCPITESVSNRLLRLPFYTGLSEADQIRVVTELTRYKTHCAQS